MANTKALHHSLLHLTAGCHLITTASAASGARGGSTEEQAEVMRGCKHEEQLRASKKACAGLAGCVSFIRKASFPIVGEAYS